MFVHGEVACVDNGLSEPALPLVFHAYDCGLFWWLQTLRDRWTDRLRH